MNKRKKNLSFYFLFFFSLSDSPNFGVAKGISKTNVQYYFGKIYQAKDEPFTHPTKILQQSIN